MSLCQFGTEHECGCPADACAVQPVTPAPVIIPSLKTQAITCLFIGFVVTIISAAVMETKLRTADLNCQEACVNVVRR